MQTLRLRSFFVALIFFGNLNLLPVKEALAEPFGLHMGETPAEAHAGNPISDVAFEILPPDPMGAEIGRYTGMFGPQTGLCKVFAYGHLNSGDDDGMWVRQQVDGMAEELAKVFGKASKQDGFFPGAHPSMVEDFAADVAHQKRVYAYRWLHGIHHGNLEAVAVEA